MLNNKIASRNNRMTKFFIKAYSFTDFINKEWGSWKDRKMAEAYDAVEGLFNEMAQEAGNQSKMPLMFDEDDWKFLIQFPPKLWQAALVWRYNDGLLKASEAREDHPSHSNEALPKTGDVQLGKYLFKNINLGFDKLFERLEKPIKGHSGAFGDDDASLGIQDINPFEIGKHPKGVAQDHPQHRSNYKHGLMDYDLSKPVIMSDDYIDDMTDEEVATYVRPPVTKEKIDQKRKALKKNKPHTTAGMSVLQSGPQASKILNSWIKAQGLGLLGDTPTNLIDPQTGQPMETIEGHPGQSIKSGDDGESNWASHVGKNPIQLKTNMIKRKVKMQIVEGNGKTALENRIAERQEIEQKLAQNGNNAKLVKKLEKINQEIANLEKQANEGIEYTMPVLNAGRALPQIALTPQQKIEIKKRKNKEVKENDPREQGAAPGDISWLLDNFDILTPEQIEELKTNSRDLYHLAAADYGGIHKMAHPDEPDRIVDKWSFPKGYYVVGGWQPNYSGLKIRALPKENQTAIIEKYYNKFLKGEETAPDENDTSIIPASRIKRGTLQMLDRFVADRTKANEKGSGNISNEVIEAIHGLGPNISKVAAALLVLNANDPKTGVYDPDLGLYGVHPSTPLADLERDRYNFVFNFALNIAQKIMGGRRIRQKMGKTVSSNTPTKGKEGSTGELGDTIAGGGEGGGNAASRYGDVKGVAHDTRRLHMAPARQDANGEEIISSMTWKLPEISHEIKKLFLTKRALIAANMPGLTGVVDSAIRDIDAATAAEEDIRDRRENDPAVKASQDEYMGDFFKQIIDGRASVMPQYDPESNDYSGIAFNGREFTLADMVGANGQPLDAKGIVRFIKSYWSVEGAEKWGVPLLMAIKKHIGRPIPEEQAKQEIHIALNPAAELPEPEATPEKQPETPAATPAIPADTVRVPQKPTAIAATDLTGLLAQFPQNPALWKQLKQRENELLAPSLRPALDASIEAVRNVFKKKDFRTLTEDEQEAYALVFDLKRKEQQKQ